MKFGRARTLHLVGIGGSGMSGIAEVLINLRYVVTGSDAVESEAVRRLRRLGGTIHLGHRAHQVHGADVVVTSTAIAADNPEVVEARRLGIPVIPRAEMLAELMRMKSGIAVGGSHGKTSVTSMVAQVLHLAGLDPTIVIGGRLAILDSSAKLGRGDLMVVEADESDGSFLKLRPKTAVITNIDREHLDHYGTFAALGEAFVAFANSVPFYGQVVAGIDDPEVRSILPRLTRRVMTYGVAADADLRAESTVVDGFGSRSRVLAAGRDLGELTLQVPGRHQVINALAAVAVGLDCDVPFGRVAEALASFAGADRRFQRKGEVRDILVVDDYGHHPTEIRATLAAAQEGWGRRVVVVFQPHRYSRVAALLPEFGACFTAADVVLVTEIYPAGEAPVPGVTGTAVAAAVREAGHRDARFIGEVTEAPAALVAATRPGDLVITLGAGSVTRVGDLFLNRLRSMEAA